MIAVMLATFLSPTFAWHMNAGHHEIAAEAQPAHKHDHDGEHLPKADGLGDAHASIGHLLGHLPMQVSEFEVAVPAAQDVAPPADTAAPPYTAETSPPYRPPLATRLA